MRSSGWSQDQEETVMFIKRMAQLLAISTLAAACTVSTTGTAREPTAPASQPTRSARTVDASQAERLRRVMVPLLAAMDHPRQPGQVKLGIVDDPHINAASAGNGEFYITTGLLEKANDFQLAGVLAHELAHDDLGHVAKAQRLNTGLKLGMVLLDQVFPGSGNITPIAGTLVARSYGRKEEYEADRHAVDILQRVGLPKQVMADTLTWLMQVEGGSGGGFLATHPATSDRIQALRKL
jgi:Zn-dependent protease with chaperone function